MNISYLFDSTGAFHPGHTVFKNGLHSDGWIEKNAVLRNPRVLEEIAKFQAEQIKSEYPDTELLLGPIVGGAILVSHVVRFIDKPYGIITGKEKPYAFHGLNIPKKGTKVVLVEDIISSGVDMQAFIEFVKEKEVQLLGVSVWIDRQSGSPRDTKITSLMPAPFEIYKKENCPLCKESVEIKFSDIRE